MKRLSVKTLRSLMVNALEGGSNYWYMIEGTRLAHGLKDKDFFEGGAQQDSADYYHWSQLVPTTKDCALLISSQEDPDKGVMELTLEKLHKGVAILHDKFPHHYAAIITEDDDADIGDALLQCALFGDIIYG